MIPFCYRTLKMLQVSCLLLFLSLPVLSQIKTNEIPGIEFIGGRGVGRTTNEIMARERELDALGIQRPVRMHPEHEVEREDLPQNPLSPGVSQWPAKRIDQRSAEELGILSPQTVSTSFTGVTLADAGAFPPDGMGAVGPTQFIVDVNGRIRSFNKSTGVADGVLNANTDNFFSTVMTPPLGTNFTSDPRIRYDRLSGRWIAIMIDVPGGSGSLPNRVMLAVSDGNTITGSTVWTYFFFAADASLFGDYPTLGIDQNALYIGCNMFTTGGSFSNTKAFVVRKSSILGAGPIVVTSFSNLINTGTGVGPWTPQGVDNFDASATEGYFIGVDNATFGTLILRRISNPGGSPSISSSISLTVPATAFPTTVPHLGNTQGANGELDALDDRLYAAVIRSGHLWTAHNIRVSNSGSASGTTSRDAARWYDINNLSTTPALVQSGTVYAATGANDTLQRNYWIPSLMISGQGHVAMGFSVAGVSERANAGTVGRLAGDPAGSMQTPLLYTNTASAYNPASDPGGAGGRRWGDYSYTSLDPADDMTMWTIQEFCDATNSWGCRVVKLLAPLPATPSAAAPTSGMTGTTINVAVTGTSSSGSGFFDPGVGFTNRIAASVDGGGVTVNSVTYTSPTSITLNVTIAGNASTGGRTITVTNPDGQSVTSGSAIFTVSPGSCPTISLSPATLPDGAAGAAYNQTVTASGGQSPYSFSVTSGSLPSGISLSSGGVLSGTPGFGGASNFTISANDANGCSGSQSYTLTVTGCPSITLSPTTLPDGTVGSSYSQTITASGGTAPYTFTVTSGSLPAGLSLATDGTLSGSPTAGGTSNFTVTATDGSGNSCTGARAYSLTINTPVLTDITLSSLGSAYTQNFSTLATTGTSNTWTDNSTIPGWFVSTSTYAASTGSSTTGALYSFGASGNSERALGSLASGSTGTLLYGARFVNQTGTTITSLAIAFTGEQWRNGGNATAQTLSFQYQVANSGVITSISGGTWTDFSSLDFPSPIHTASAGALDGNSAANRTALSATLNVTVANGQEVWVRWRDLNDTGTDHGLAVDDFSLTPQGASSTNPSGSGLANPSTVIAGNATLLTVTVTPGTNPTSTGLAVTGNLSTIGGSASQTFYDDGTHGDVTGSNNIFSFSATVSAGTSAGGKTLPISITDAQSRSGSASINLTVQSACPTITVSPGSLPGGTVAVAYNQTITASGGTSPYTFAVTIGTLPAGLTLTSGGALAGTPTSAATSNFTVTATDASGNTCTGSQAYSITINPPSCPSITVSPTTLPNGTVNVAYNQTITASGGTAPYTFAVTTGTLPSGLTLTSGGGLSGTPMSAATSNFTVTATDASGNNCSGSQAYGITINPPSCPTITLSPATLPGGTVGIVYNQTITASGGTSPYTFAVTIGSVPSGLTLASGGVLSGTPTSAATSNFTVTATDASGNNCSGSQAYSITINSPSCPTITLSPVSLPSGEVGTSYLQTITASGGTVPYSFAVTSGSLPVGLSLTSGGGLLGTPITVATSNFVVTATDASGNNCSGSQAYSLTINPPNCPNIIVAPSTLPAGTIGTAYNQVLTASGGTLPYTFVVATGTLPDGMTLTSGGTLSGIPTVVTTADFTVTATDASGNNCAGSQAYSLVINCPSLTVLGATLPNGTMGIAYAETLTATGGAEPYSFSMGAGVLPAGVTLSSAGVFSGIPSLADSEYFTVNVLDANGCPGSRQYSLKIVPNPIVSISIAVKDGWNIVSRPLVMSNDSVHFIFAEATSEAFAYIPGFGYQVATTLENGTGYWLRFSGNHFVKVLGTQIDAESVDVSDGWNLVGTLSTKVPASALVGIGTSISSRLFGYEGSYVIIDTLEPGKGVWVKCNGPGKLGLAVAPINLPSASERTATLDLTGFGRLTFTDPNGERQVLYLGSDNRISPEQYTLPPLPPYEGFDVRFAKDRMLEVFEPNAFGQSLFRISIQSRTYPITIRWENGLGASERISVRDTKGNLIASTAELASSESFRISDDRITTLVLKVQDAGTVPAQVTLFDNYPNPFNPTTRIRFGLPAESYVTLRVFNMLGQEVSAIMENRLIEEGMQETEFDAGSLPAGIYMYRLTTSQRLQNSGAAPPSMTMKKMILLK